MQVLVGYRNLRAQPESSSKASASNVLGILILYIRFGKMPNGKERRANRQNGRN